MGVTIQSHILFARKVQKYGDAFSKSSSIYMDVAAIFVVTRTTIDPMVSEKMFENVDG